MNEIDSISIINRKNLDECDYFKTLLENCPEGSVIFLATCNVYQLDKEAKEKKVQLEKEMLQHLKMLKRNCIV